MENIETDAKVKMMFALKAPVNSDFSEKLKIQADIVLDEQQKIIEYTKKGGGLELKAAYVKVKVNVSQNFSMRDKMSEDDDEREDKSIEPVESVITQSGRVSKRRFNYGDDYTDNTENFSNKKRKEYTSKQIKTGDSKPSEEILVKTEVTDLTNSTEVTSHFKFLDALKSLILFLDIPSLYSIRSKIHQKIMGSTVKLIPNTEILMAMEMCMLKLSNHSDSAHLDSDGNCSLRDVFCYLKAVILNSKFDGIEQFLTKLKANIEHLYLQDKRIPVSKVESVLGAMLDFVDL